MELSDLRIFRAVVREGGVTRAAERLHRVQSNVTTRIRQLEEDLDTALFIREGKRLHLAPAGQVLLGYADRLLALADEARAAVLDPRPRGMFRLGAMESTAAVRLPGTAERISPALSRGGAGASHRQSRSLGSGDARRRARCRPGRRADRGCAVREDICVRRGAGDRVGGRPSAVGKKRQFSPNRLVFEHGCPHRKRLEEWYAKRGRCRNALSNSAPITRCSAALSPAWAYALLPKSVLTTFPEGKRLRSIACRRGRTAPKPS